MIIFKEKRDYLLRRVEQKHNNNKLWFRVQYKNNKLTNKNIFLSSQLLHSLWFVHAQFYHGLKSYQDIVTLFVCQLNPIEVFNAKSKVDYNKFNDYFRTLIETRPDIIDKYEKKSSIDYDLQGVMRKLELFDMQATEDKLIQGVIKKLGYAGFINREDWTYGPASDAYNCCIFDNSNIKVLKSLDFYDLEKAIGFKRFRDTNEKELRNALVSIM
jgi:hypothetical protein